LGTTLSSSLLCANIGIVQLIMCANTVLLLESSRAPLDTNGTKYHNGTNVYTLAAAGVENTFRFVRVGFLLPIYLIRLLYVVSPHRIIHHQSRGLSSEKLYCVIIWAVGISIAGFRTYVRIVRLKETEDEKSVVTLQKIAASILIVTELFHLVGMALALLSILYMTKTLLKHRPDNIGPGPNRSSNAQNNRGTIYSTVKSSLQMLTLLFLTDLIFVVYLSLHYAMALKMKLTPGCYPELWVRMRNYLGTPTNFIYSYHCLDVLHGIFTCLIFFLQSTMRHTLKFMWEFACLMVRYWVGRTGS
jgi:hypothetical protein